jgi:hypothetical protein
MLCQLVLKTILLSLSKSATILSPSFKEPSKSLSERGFWIYFCSTLFKGRAPKLMSKPVSIIYSSIALMIEKTAMPNLSKIAAMMLSCA